MWRGYLKISLYTVYYCKGILWYRLISKKLIYPYLKVGFEITFCTIMIKNRSLMRIVFFKCQYSHSSGIE